MQTVKIPASREYNVYIERGLLRISGEIAKGISKGSKALLISDSNVEPLYGQFVKTSLQNSGFEVTSFTVKAGETSKNPENLIKACNLAIESGLTRSDLVVALGGGVITDLSGLVAALYQRGVALLQIPTSLLAMVDSSVGGKTAVNLESGKNMFGAFYQPFAVLCDADVLKTLPPCEYSNGMAEVIKYAFLKGGRVLEILLGDPEENICELIEECVKIKREYVCDDEFDKGKRQFLNLGHTVGHAIERSSNLEISHGSAVAAGMCIVARACEKLSFTDKETVKLMEELSKKYNLPVSTDIKSDTLYLNSLSDKKREGQSLTFVMIKRAGECFLHKTSTEFMKEILRLGLEETV